MDSNKRTTLLDQINTLYQDNIFNWKAFTKNFYRSYIPEVE